MYIERATRFIRKFIGEKILYHRFPYKYAHYLYWHHLGKELDWKHPQDIDQKLFWLAMYYQDPRVVSCTDKLAVREYIKECGLNIF